LKKIIEVPKVVEKLVEVPVEKIVIVKERNYELEQKLKNFENMKNANNEGFAEAEEWKAKFAQLQSQLENKFRVELARLEVEYRNQINDYESRIGSMSAQMEALRNAPPRVDV